MAAEMPLADIVAPAGGAWDEHAYKALARALHRAPRREKNAIFCTLCTSDAVNAISIALCIAASVDVNTQGGTPLVTAARDGRLWLVQALLQKYDAQPTREAYIAAALHNRPACLHALLQARCVAAEAGVPWAALVATVWDSRAWGVGAVLIAHLGWGGDVEAWHAGAAQPDTPPLALAWMGLVRHPAYRLRPAPRRAL